MTGLSSRRLRSVLLLLVLFMPCALEAGAAETLAPTQAGLDRITAFFDTEVASGRIPGAVVLIQQHGKQIYMKTFGMRDVATKSPMTPDALFALHSMTKPITSVAAMMLVDAGKMALDDPIAKYIPSFAGVQVGVTTKGADGKPVLRRVAPKRPPTVADLLRHTSGITYEYTVDDLINQAYANADLFAGDFDNATFAERIAKLPLAGQPGTLWRYGASTDVLGRVIEVASGQTLYDFEKQHIFDPLGMTSTKYVLESDAERARMAEPSPSDPELVDAERERRSHRRWQSGAAGLVSTAADYARFSQMILQRGVLDGKRYLSPKSYAQMTTDHVGPGSGVVHDADYFPGTALGFGFGFAVRINHGSSAERPEPGSIGELKWNGGSGPQFVIDPSRDMVAVMMVQVGADRGRVQHAFEKLVYEAPEQ
ncbi:MAG: beta-lactamase family protein [Rhizobiales bacterium]|nr:beta-lactamase family protein [Hyphomicrobiales bacterium]